ncbi:MAG: TIGR02302 family protein [Rhizobiaceae bacterium]|nr:TIGR02302 family protein [Rhizobiaceae bacterium]MCV0407699.1 TIGR02302 family protein [Rhizobiaceae bacterium]
MTGTGPHRHSLLSRPVGAVSRLARTRFVTGGMILLERLWPRLLLPTLILGLFLILSWFGIFRMLPDLVRIALAGLFALGFAASLYPVVSLRRAGVAEVDRRIELANRLEHAPVATQSDRIAGGGDGFAQALWLEHQKRMAERLGRLSPDMPRTGLPERDPFALRGAIALLLVIAFAFSFGPMGGRLTDAFVAQAGPSTPPPRVDAWVTPPAYTRKAPIFLTADANQTQSVFTVPENSQVTLRVTGGTGAETLEFAEASGEVHMIEPAGDASADRPAPSPPSARQFGGTLERDGTLTLRSGEEEVQGWSFSIVPDAPPVIRFSGEPSRALNGTLELTYEIEDDYGAVSARAEFSQAEDLADDARPLFEAPDMPLTLPRREARGPVAKTARDLTEHPWAGVVVDLNLEVEDAAGQIGLSETKRIRMPERPFTNPLARAVIEQRRILALDANRKERVLELIDATTLRPEDTIDNPSHYLGIMTGRTKLQMADTDEKLRGVVDYFWELALAIEDGDLSAAERRLRQAQEALRQALENGASDEEIEQLMAELREAMQEFLREFAERAQQNPNLSMQMPQNGQELSQSDLDRMLDQIEELAKSGARDQAQELLSQLQDMMNNLQAGRPQQGQQGQQGQSQMREQMDRLGEMMRRQQELMNETFRMDQMQRGQQGQRGQPGEGEQGQQGQGQPMTPEEFAEAMRQLQEQQGRLQQQLGELMDALEGMGIQPGEGFGEAERNMGEAADALGEGEGERAVGDQGEALEALRQGAQDMMQQMQQAQQGDQGGGQEGGRQQNAERDPLGRPRATTGPDFGDSVNVPDEIDVQRAREILEAIRRRLGNALSPELEREYLERLLEMR